jgi:hypothetical protein
LAYEEREQTFSTFIAIRFAMNKDLAKLSVNAHDIHMSIAKAGLNFGVDGLTLSNGKFKIIKESEGKNEVVLGADLDGNFYVKGRVEATSGSFTGAVYAEKGAFTGEIYASRGQLGYLNIEKSLCIEDVDGKDTRIDIGKYSY